MLTSDLLVTRMRQGKIEPVFAPLDRENLGLASSIIDVFQKHVGKTYGELLEEIEGLEDINYRFIRGLAQILENRCVIDKDAIIDPTSARRAVFEESGGFISSEEERTEILDRVSRKLSIKSADLEKALWADQEENLVVKDFQTMSPENLLRQYNLSLAQTLLFKATGMEILIEDKYQEVFRRIKHLGLIYTICDGKIYLDGPISLFKLTEKYGSSFAKLLPTIVSSARWSLKASILKKTMQGKRIYDFNLDHTSRRFLGKETGNRTVTFDSSVEKDFYQFSFNGWVVSREPEVLKAGKYAFIPDFSLERNDARIYVEIIGFWTPEYLRNKTEKINSLDEKESLILLVNKNLACSSSDFKTDNVIFYDKKIPYLEIIKILREYEKKWLSDEIARLENTEISLDDNTKACVIGLEEAAGRYGVSPEALKEVIRKGANNSKDGDGANYLLLGEQLVGRQVLEALRGEFEGVRRYEDAVEILNEHGIKAHAQAIELLGYRVKWSGISPENAEIIKIIKI